MKKIRGLKFMKRNKTIYKMSLVAILIAIMLILGFTPLGTIQMGIFTISLLGIPVAIAACLYGPYFGALIGLVWGTISLIQGITGMDVSGPLLLEYSPIGLVVTCIVPRVLTGYLAGLIYKLNTKWDKKGRLNSIITCGLVPVFNTVFFMSSYVAFFYFSDLYQSSAEYLSTQYGVNAFNPILFIVFAVGINFIVELSVNMVVGSAAVFGLKKATKSLNLE